MSVLEQISQFDQADYRCQLFAANGQLLNTLKLSEVSDALKVKEHFVWLDAHEPGPELTETIRELFGLHELSIEDMLNPAQRAKIETYDNSAFILIRSATQLNDELKVGLGSVAVFFAEQFAVVIRIGRTASLDQFTHSVFTSPNILNQGPVGVVHGVLDHAIDGYLQITDELSEYVSGAESLIFSDRFDSETLKQLYHIKVQVIRLRAALLPHQDICNYFLNHKQNGELGFKSSELRPYFRDVLDHILRASDAVNNSSEMISVAIDTYTTAVSMQQNIIVRKLSAWAGILAVPTLFSSFYGMNFKHMPELSYQYSYPVFIVTMLTICVLLWRSFRRIKWL